MAKTNVNYVSKVYGINEKKRFVKCSLTFEIDLDKVPGIEMLETSQKYDDFVNSLINSNQVKCFNATAEGIYSVHGVLVFKTEGIAQCSPEDEFDVELGRKLACTRAQRAAFIRANALYRKFGDILYEPLEQMYDLGVNSLTAFERCFRHEHELTGNEPSYEGGWTCNWTCN